MVAMDERLDQMLAHLDGLQPQENADTLTAEAVAQLLSKTEQQWGQEIRTLKQDLEHIADQMHVTTLCFVIGGPFFVVLLGFL
eukprot:symbB.v1.2.039558.t1/scaffold6646.1/size16504/2